MATAFQDTRPANRIRVETDQRWSRAFDRALASGVDAIEIPGGGWAVPSSSEPNVRYRVSPDGCHCTCQSARSGDAICWHRAMCRYFLGTCPGVPNSPDPDDEITVQVIVEPAVSSLTKCMECNGGGVIWDQEVAKYGGWHPTCHACRGTGQVQPERFAA